MTMYRKWTKLPGPLTIIGVWTSAPPQGRGNVENEAEEKTEEEASAAKNSGLLFLAQVRKTIFNNLIKVRVSVCRGTVC